MTTLEQTVLTHLENSRENGRIGVMFSGGLDSTLLLYLLNKNLKSAQSIKTFTVSNRCGYDNRVQKILQLPEFSKVSSQLNVFNLNNYDGEIDWAILNVLYCGEVSLLFSGVTKNPPIQASKPPERPTKIVLNRHPRLVCPLLDSTKDEIVNAYYKLKIEHLIPYTYSCTENKFQPCGICFQCAERKWAFESAGFADTLNVAK